MEQQQIHQSVCHQIYDGELRNEEHYTIQLKNKAWIKQLVALKISECLIF